MVNFQDIGPNNLKPGSMKRIELNGLCILIANLNGALTLYKTPALMKMPRSTKAP